MSLGWTLPFTLVTQLLGQAFRVLSASPCLYFIMTYTPCPLSLFEVEDSNFVVRIFHSSTDFGETLINVDILCVPFHEPEFR